MINGKVALKSVMLKKGMKSGQVADALGYKSRQVFFNWLSSNAMSLAKFAIVADALGCDVVLLDRETGEIYR